jgi:serine/threonine protein kinase
MAAACAHCGQRHEAYVTMCPVTGARLVNPSYTLVNEDEALVGNIIGERYHLRDILGQGSTGTVFGTVHMHFERGGAMKVLRPRFTARDTVLRAFHDESRLAFSLSHPSLCEVFDIGTLPDGAPFFVMERLEGDTLASRLGRERFSIAAAVDLLMQLLSVMDAVHGRELLFRDLRPQNLFLANRRGCRPVLKVLDFGLSSLIPLEQVQRQWDALRAVASVTDSSGALSIPYYLSPERTRSEHGLEPASDLFVAAVIFYEALTGQKPFSGATWNTLLDQIAQAQTTPLSVLRPEIPEELGSLVMRALSANPRARPPTAREMQDELRAVFEAPKRGSQSMRSAPASVPDAAPHTPPTAHIPVQRPAAGVRAGEMLPPSGLMVAQPALALAPRVDELYEDETRTDHKHTDVTLAARVDARVVDEASADHPVLTLRPPVAVDIDVDIDMGQMDPATSRGNSLEAALSLSKRRSDEDDETETMELTPEVRARIEAMTKAAQGAGVEDSSRPPPTRRLTKPPK